MSKIRPSCHTAPTFKLTDTNNAAQPELSFQRKAVQAFRTAQEITSCIDANICSKSEEDENGDDQPRPSTFLSSHLAYSN